MGLGHAHLEEVVEPLDDDVREARRELLEHLVPHLLRVRGRVGVRG